MASLAWFILLKLIYALFFSDRFSPFLGPPANDVKRQGVIIPRREFRDEGRSALREAQQSTETHRHTNRSTIIKARSSIFKLKI